MQTINIDIKALLFALETDLKNLGLSKTPEVVAAFTETTENAKARMIPLALGLTDGSIDEEFAKKQFSDDVNVFKTELLSYSVIGQSIAQEGRDQSITTIATTVLAVLLQLITKL